MTTDLSDLVEQEHDDPEYIPEILPVDARLSVRGPVATFIELFERAARITPVKEVIDGTGFALLETFQTSFDEVAHMRVTATDGDQTLSIISDGVVVSMAGAVLVPGKKILEILKSAPDTLVRIEVIGLVCTIRSGRAQWSVQTPAGDSLSPPPTVDDIPLHEVLVDPFRKALVVARRSASTSAGRMSMMQVQVRNASITGTDGGRLHRQGIEGFPTDIDLAIPVKVADELIRALTATDSEYFQLGSNDWHLVFRIDQDSLIAQRLLVPFPNSESLILGPAFSNDYALTVDRKELAEVIKRVRINADPDYAAIFLATVPGKKDATGTMMWSLAVRARDQIGNAAQEIIPAQWTGTTKARELCVNHRYLSDFLDSYKGEMAIFKIGEDTKSVRQPLFLEDTTEGFVGYVQQMHSNFIS